MQIARALEFYPREWNCMVCFLPSVDWALLSMHPLESIRWVLAATLFLPSKSVPPSWKFLSKFPWFRPICLYINQYFLAAVSHLPCSKNLRSRKNASLVTSSFPLQFKQPALHSCICKLAIRHSDSIWVCPWWPAPRIANICISLLISRKNIHDSVCDILNYQPLILQLNMSRTTTNLGSFTKMCPSAPVDEVTPGKTTANSYFVFSAIRPLALNFEISVILKAAKSS